MMVSQGHLGYLRSGPCSDFTPVHGFMEFYPSASLPKQDVWDVSCLGGWTAGNYVGSVADVARFTYELYNTKMLGIERLKSTEDFRKVYAEIQLLRMFLLF